MKEDQPAPAPSHPGLTEAAHTLMPLGHQTRALLAILFFTLASRSQAGRGPQLQHSSAAYRFSLFNT